MVLLQVPTDKRAARKLPGPLSRVLMTALSALPRGDGLNSLVSPVLELVAVTVKTWPPELFTVKAETRVTAGCGRHILTGDIKFAFGHVAT